MNTTEERLLTDDEIDALRKPVSQGKLVWTRFKRHKLGVLGAILICGMVFIFALAEFIGPYDYLKPHHEYAFIPPMYDKVHFNGLSPYVCDAVKIDQFVTLQSGVTLRLPGVFEWGENCANDDIEGGADYPIKLFAQGDEYKLLGLIKTNIHLYGTEQAPRSNGHWFPLGTNDTGHDQLSQILFGGRITLGIAPMVILVSFIVGSFLGGLSGYLSGAVDTLIQRFVEIFMSLPRLALLLAIAGILTYLGYIPPMVRFWSIVGLLALISWAPLARVIRGQFLSLREQEFTQAARALGAGNTRIIFRQIMPNIMSYLVVAATLAIPDIIILESILSFLGYGIQHPLTSWGTMLYQLQGEGFALHAQTHPWLFMPALFIVVSVLSFNFLGDALRDALDPFAVSGVKEDFQA